MARIATHLRQQTLLQLRHVLLQLAQPQSQLGHLEVCTQDGTEREGKVARRAPRARATRRSAKRGERTLCARDQAKRLARLLRNDAAHGRHSRAGFLLYTSAPAVRVARGGVLRAAASGSVVARVGEGAAARESEGAGPAPRPRRRRAATRKKTGGCGNAPRARREPSVARAACAAAAAAAMARHAPPGAVGKQRRKFRPHARSRARARATAANRQQWEQYAPKSGEGGC